MIPAIRPVSICSDDSPADKESGVENGIIQQSWELGVLPVVIVIRPLLCDLSIRLDNGDRIVTMALTSA
jgi:hypothetical protein